MCKESDLLRKFMKDMKCFSLLRGLMPQSEKKHSIWKKKYKSFSQVQQNRLLQVPRMYFSQWCPSIKHSAIYMLRHSGKQQRIKQKLVSITMDFFPSVQNKGRTRPNLACRLVQCHLSGQQGWKIEHHWVKTSAAMGESFYFKTWVLAFWVGPP